MVFHFNALRKVAIRPCFMVGRAGHHVSPPDYGGTPGKPLTNLPYDGSFFGGFWYR